MPTKSGAARLSNTKVLVAVLLACSASAEAITEGPIRSAHVLDSLIAAAEHAPVPIKRGLRADVPMATNDDADTFEERTTSSEVITVPAIDLLAKLQAPHLQSLTPDQIFQHLNVGSEDVSDVLKSERFFRWIDEVMSKEPNPSVEHFKPIYSIMSAHYNNDAALTEHLVTLFKVKGLRLGRSLRKAQVKVWMDEKKDAASVYRLLKLDHSKDGNPFKNPVFVQWAEFVWSKRPEEFKAAAFGDMFNFLSKYRGGDAALTEDLLAGKAIVDTTDIVKRLLDVRFLKAIIAGESEEDVLKLLRLSKTETGTVKGQHIDIWRRYKILRKRTPSEISDKLAKTFDDVELAVLFTVTKSETDFGIKVQQTLREKQFNKWMNEPLTTELATKMLSEGGIDRASTTTIVDDYNAFLKDKKPVA